MTDNANVNVAPNNPAVTPAFDLMKFVQMWRRSKPEVCQEIVRNLRAFEEEVKNLSHDECKKRLKEIKNFEKALSDKNMRLMEANAHDLENSNKVKIQYEFMKKEGDKLEQMMKEHFKLKQDQKSEKHGHARNKFQNAFSDNHTKEQSVMDSIKHMAGYDPVSISITALLLSTIYSLRFMIGSRYWEMLVEYQSAKTHSDPNVRDHVFDPENWTPDQYKIFKKMIPEAERTATFAAYKATGRAIPSIPYDTVLNAGFLPPPTTAKAYASDIKYFMSTLGAAEKPQAQHEGSMGDNQLVNRQPAKRV